MKELVFHRILLPATERFADKVGFLDADSPSPTPSTPTASCQLANALRSELGVSRDDRFAVMALNGHHYLELYHAAFLGGGVINPLNLRLARAGARPTSSPTPAPRSCFVDPFFAGAHRPVRARDRHRDRSC